MKIFSLIAAVSATSNCERKTYCTDISANSTVTNSWTCKDCFNVRVKADLNDVTDGNWFSNKDSVYIAFDDEVNYLKAAGPVDDVTYWGENDGVQIYQINFIKNHEFLDRRIDSNIEFKRPGLLNIHAWTKICPCLADPTTTTTASTTTTSTTTTTTSTIAERLTILHNHAANIYANIAGTGYAKRFEGRMTKIFEKLEMSYTGEDCYEENGFGQEDEEATDVSGFDADDMCKLNKQISSAINSHARHFACQGRGKVYRQIIRSARKVKTFFEERYRC